MPIRLGELGQFITPYTPSRGSSGVGASLAASAERRRSNLANEAQNSRRIDLEGDRFGQQKAEYEDADRRNLMDIVQQHLAAADEADPATAERHISAARAAAAELKRKYGYDVAIDDELGGYGAGPAPEAQQPEAPTDAGPAPRKSSPGDAALSSELDRMLGAATQGLETGGDGQGDPAYAGDSDDTAATFGALRRMGGRGEPTAALGEALDAAAASATQGLEESGTGAGDPAYEGDDDEAAAVRGGLRRMGFSGAVAPKAPEPDGSSGFITDGLELDAGQETLDPSQLEEFQQASQVSPADEMGLRGPLSPLLSGQPGQAEAVEAELVSPAAAASPATALSQALVRASEQPKTPAPPSGVAMPSSGVGGRHRRYRITDAQGQEVTSGRVGGFNAPGKMETAFGQIVQGAPADEKPVWSSAQRLAQELSKWKPSDEAYAEAYRYASEALERQGKTTRAGIVSGRGVGGRGPAGAGEAYGGRSENHLPGVGTGMGGRQLSPNDIANVRLQAAKQKFVDDKRREAYARYGVTESAKMRNKLAQSNSMLDAGGMADWMALGQQIKATFGAPSEGERAVVMNGAMSKFDQAMASVSAWTRVHGGAELPPHVKAQMREAFSSMKGAIDQIEAEALQEAYNNIQYEIGGYNFTPEELGKVEMQWGMRRPAGAGNGTPPPAAQRGPTGGAPPRAPAATVRKPVEPEDLAL